MGYGKLPVASGEMRVGKMGAGRMAAGKKVLDVWLVQNNQKKDAEGKYVDDKEVWIKFTFWEKEAENVMASIREKDLVLVQFEFWGEEYKKDDGVVVRYIAARPLTPLAVSTKFRTYPHHDQQQQTQQGGQQQGGQQQQGQQQGQQEDAPF